MLKHENTIISHLSVHHIGNKTNGEDIHISKSSIDASEPHLQRLLLKYFLDNFNSPEYYNFSFSNEDFTMNPVYTYIKQVFNDNSSLHFQSIQLAKLLFESSQHPNIKAGDFYVAHFSEVDLGDEIAEAIGLFKCETREDFLKLKSSGEGYALSWEDGINIDKLDKGCLIFNSHSESGYKVMVLDRSNKGSDAQYWKNTFLNLKPMADNYHDTVNFLGFTKSFVKEKLEQEFEVAGADKANYLQRSMNYFKNHEQFDEEEFTEQVFNDSLVVESFHRFKNQYADEKGIEINDEFTISTPAVQKQSRVFKSIIKLDKNFHIYIHGDREQIEKGVEPNGRKFYKIYYDKES